MGVQQRGKDPHSWSIRYDEPVAPGEPRRRVRKAFNGTKKEAMAECLRLEGRSKRGLSTASRGNVPFLTFVDEWLAHRKGLVTRGGDSDDDEISPATYDADRRRIKNHIIPVLGKYKIGHIGAREIERAKQAWKVSKSVLSPERTLARKTIFHIFGLTRKIFNDAVLWKYIESNPCNGVSPPKKGTRTLEAVPIEDARRLMGHVSIAPIHVAALLALLTGARRGEILALTRADCDLAAGVIWFHRSLTSLDGEVFTKDIKTGSKGRRKVPLLFLADLLAAYFDDNPGLGDGPIFPSGGLRKNYGRFWHPRAFSSALARHLTTLGIRDASAHRLRHAFNSIGAAGGTDEAVRSKMMGHTTVQMTRDGYTTIYAQQAREAIRLLEVSLKMGPNWDQSSEKPI